MHPPASSSPDFPTTQYQQLQRAREAQAAQLEKVHIRLGNLRLLVVIAAIAELWAYFHTYAFSPWWLLTPVALFIAIAAYHSHILRKRVQTERAADFYRKGIARIEDKWHGSGPQTAPIDISAHLYAADLDLFGPASLFELLSQARTRMGEETLARWLLGPATIPQIHARHAAIAELAPRLTLREDMAVVGERLKVGVHPEPLIEWATAPNHLLPTWLRWLALFLAIAAIASAILWIELGTKIPFLTVLILEGILTLVFRKKIRPVLHTTEHALHDLQLLAALLSRLETESFQAPSLQVLKQKLSGHHITGSKAIAHLHTIGEHIDSLGNPFVKLFDVPLMYSIQTAYAAESWRTTHGHAVARWIEAIGEAEALLSLSAYHFEHPADPFPEFIPDTVPAPPSITAESLGHPLIPAAKCIHNDISISGETRVLLISGSNMSGKSTLMRAVGINTVLAMAGAPVRASRLQLSPLQVGASILINDSLQEGASRFYAEITRLRHLCDLAQRQPPLLFLLDELLQGTNSKDRLIGAEGVVRALLEAGAIGLISTHDLALTHLTAIDTNALHNVHLQDEIEDGKMKFDYKLRDGVVTHSNGIELMRLIGLKV